MKKKLKIFLLIFIITLILFFTFNKFIIELMDNMVYSIYENKYDNIERIEKTLIYNKEQSLLEENNIDMNRLNINLSNIKYTNENELSFELKFLNSKYLNDIGYILRVYTEEYSLGDKYNGKINLTSQEKIYYERIFLDKTFENTKKYSNEHRMYIQQNNKEEFLEDGSLIHKISFKLPEEFIIKDKLNILLYDISYQNIGDNNFYPINENLIELKYEIINKENND